RGSFGTPVQQASAGPTSCFELDYFQARSGNRRPVRKLESRGLLVTVGSLLPVMRGGPERYFKLPVASLVILRATVGGATGLATCDSGPQSDWQSQDAGTKHLMKAGWKAVRRMKPDGARS